MRRGIGVERSCLAGELDGRSVGTHHRTVAGLPFAAAQMLGKGSLVGKGKAEGEVVKPLAHAGLEFGASRERGERLPEVGTNVFVGSPALELVAVTREVRNLRAQLVERFHGRRLTTPPGEGPRMRRGKIVRVKPATMWPAYLVAAACFAIALISSIANISLLGQVKQQQRELAHLSGRSTALARNLAGERTALFDVLDTHARRYQLGDGEAVTHGSRIYLALRALPEPPHGRVYEAWTIERGSTKAVPSSTFVPDARGVALIVLSADARSTADVSVTLEPEGGSKEPTGKPLMDAAFTNP